MAEKQPSKADQVRALREGKFEDRKAKKPAKTVAKSKKAKAKK